MKLFLLVAGGAIGTTARYLISGWAYRFTDSTFPVGTLAVNLIGSFIIGLLWGLFETLNISSNTRTFIFIGILGSFTTFSSFSLETLNLFREGEAKLGIINILANNIFGISLAVLGFILSKGILNLIK